MLSPRREGKTLLGLFRTSKHYSGSTETAPKTPDRSYELPITPPQSPSHIIPGQALTIQIEAPVTLDQALEPVNHTSRSPQPYISLAHQKSSSTVPKASVARVSTIIREANRIRPQKGPEYQHAKSDDPEFWSLTLSPFEYVYLLERVQKNQDLGKYFDEELRYEYSALKNQFTILMTVTPLHGTFVDQFKDLLAKIRGNIEDGTKGYETTPKTLRDAASDIMARGDARIYFEEVLDRKQPDGSYYYDKCDQPEPSLTLEVNWSHHTREELAERAQEFIRLSKGKIRTVVIVNLYDIYQASDKGKSLRQNAEGPAAATVSVWRARTTDVDGQQVVGPEMDFHESFRDENGRIVDSFKLTLFLSDFICEEHVPTLAGCEEVGIEINAKQLCGIYERAVKEQIKENEGSSARAAIRAAVPRKGGKTRAGRAIKSVSQILRRSDRLAERNAA